MSVDRDAIRARNVHRRWYWNQHDYETYECSDCGRGLEAVDRFEVPHIDGNYRNGDPENLVGLCHRCHRARHREEEIENHIEDWRAGWGAVLDGETPKKPDGTALISSESLG